MAAAVSGLSPVIITVRMPEAAQLVEALAEAGLHDVLEADHAEDASVVGDDQRRAARARDRLDELGELGRHVAALLDDVLPDGVGRALADLAARIGEVEPRHAGLRRERHQLGVVGFDRQ